MLFNSLKSKTQPPRTGTAEPVAEEPAPRVVTGIVCACANFKTTPTSAADRILITASGKNDTRKLSIEAAFKSADLRCTRSGNACFKACNAHSAFIDFLDAIQKAWPKRTRWQVYESFLTIYHCTLHAERPPFVLMLQAGIVGLPNVGKSTLFNALTRTRKAESANYPFCTIDPNVGVVQVPDARLEPLREIAKTNRVIPAAIEFVDIAGLVAGASKGEGLGNKFLANIREVDAIVHVVRCFVDEDIIHNMGSIDPIRDIEVINTELVLADLTSLESQKEKNVKKARGGDKEAAENNALIDRLLPHLNDNKPAITLDLNEDEQVVLKRLCLLSAKRVLYACNVAESDLADPSQNAFVQAVETYAREHHGAGTCTVSAAVEAELIDFDAAEASEYLESLGVTDSGVSLLIRAAYDLLGLASYFTAGEQEVRAWTFKNGMKAPQCAGVIHTDFEKGFIKAEVVSYEDLIAAGTTAGAREAGKYRLEGKDYEFKDGDVALFRFNN